MKTDAHFQTTRKPRDYLKRLKEIDVVFLIRIHNLDESFNEKLHPSIRKDYFECLEEKRREDDYIAREG